MVHSHHHADTGICYDLILSKLDKGFNAILALCLALMGIFIFANVFLRYAFSSGLPWAEEFVPFLFVWLVFLGAIGALKDNAHLGLPR